jgi:hypothetical protein
MLQVNPGEMPVSCFFGTVRRVHTGSFAHFWVNWQQLLNPSVICRTFAVQLALHKIDVDQNR